MKKDKRLLWFAIILFLVCLGLFSLMSCSANCARVEDDGYFLGFEQGCGVVIKLQAINTGTCPAIDVNVNIRVEDFDTGETIYREDRYLTESLAPNEIIQYEIKLYDVEWGDNIGIEARYTWGSDG